MAFSRKKQDEKNLQILRELASLPFNKYCFDCNQRGPTYVNVTIGSFVCTKCSGMLRGLAPPHRVKSISMATFSQEEVDFLANHGNNYCRQTWLGLYENNLPREMKDEQIIKDFMINKYEKKRYYLEPSLTTLSVKNGSLSKTINNVPETKPSSNTLPQVKPLVINGSTKLIATITAKSVVAKKNDDFIADFGSANIYNANMDQHNNNNTISQLCSSYAVDNKSIFGPNGLPTLGNIHVSTQAQNSCSTVSFAPPEDRYAALKDLDNALKCQPTSSWNLSGSNGSLYTCSATPTSSLYSSPSPQNSVFGSPPNSSTLVNFGNIFPSQQQCTNNKISNPFNTSSVWNNDEIQTRNTTGAANPFQTEIPTVGATNNCPTWNANPFMQLGSNGYSNNPFL